MLNPFQKNILSENIVTTSVSRDRIIIWPTALACFFPLILIILWSGPFDLTFLGMPILAVTWASSALLALGIAIFSASTRNWWRTISMLVLPLVTLVVIANAGTVWLFAMETGESLISEPCAAAILKTCRSFRPRASPVSPRGTGVDLESGTPLSTTRAMKSCCRSNRQLGRRGLRTLRSDSVAHRDRP